MNNNQTIRWNTAVEEADWIAERLAPFDSGTVTSVVPEGFEAYARLLHPVHQGENLIRWAQVAEWSQTPLSHDVQFHDIALARHSPTVPAPWDSPGPAQGTLHASDAVRLVSILREHTTTPRQCWFALWEGYGWDTATRFELADEPRPARQVESPIDPVPSEVRHGPRVELPERSYLFYSGPIEAALSFIEEHEQTPNLWWPADRSWCVASEIDLAWTYVAGTESLRDQMLADHALEALQVKPQDRMTFRLTGWLDDAVMTAATELLETRITEIRTAHRSLQASLQRPTRWRSGHLDIDSHTDRGNSSTGTETLFRKFGNVSHRQLYRSLAQAVAELADL